ncbi:Rhamnogalacturonan acetylesterase [Lachnellula suecica]|uniref:Rhamnogalacturonan acetylesterase n=1 Tax=Lachnellula suecica TaxID=602035 RepID=A0A8T9CFS2_9HELO|nr:Rhamnogalacturonan acetylesterase [Lachnellula suecica]
MKVLYLLPFYSALIAARSTLQRQELDVQIPTIWIAGDSTAAPGGGGNGTEGWGQYLQYSFLPSVAHVQNNAFAGRSARTFTREGRFDNITAGLKEGDWVIIEFGHNDGGTPPVNATVGDTGREDCPGAGMFSPILEAPSYETDEYTGNQTCTTVFKRSDADYTSNVTEIVQTFPTYLKNATEIFLSKGAKVILSSMTPTNPWEFGNYSYTPTIFPYYTWLAASELGGPSAGVYFVSHGAYAAQAMKNLGKTVVDANYPLDHTHTAPYLADVVAASFVLGVKCGTSGLQGLVSNATSRLEGQVLGTCLGVNATLPI